MISVKKGCAVDRISAQAAGTCRTLRALRDSLVKILDQFNIVSYDIKWVKTSWTYRMSLGTVRSEMAHTPPR